MLLGIHTFVCVYVTIIVFTESFCLSVNNKIADK